MTHWTVVDACIKANMRDETDQLSKPSKQLVDFNASQRANATLKLTPGATTRSSTKDAVDKEQRPFARRLKDIAHVRDLKSQNYTLDFLHAGYVNPNESERTGLCARNRLNGSLRDHSNAVAVVFKASPTKASNLQISRIPIASVGTTEVAYQFSTLMVLGIANSIASFELGVGAIRDPMASGAATGKDLILSSGQIGGELFVMAHSSCELLEYAPRFMTSGSFLEKARALARAEIESLEISRVVHQTTDHLKFTCFRIVPEDEASDGTRIWFAWSLISYLAIETRLHPLLERWKFTEYDLAIAHAMLNYAKRLVGNRSRDAVSKMEKNSKDRAKRTLAQGSSTEMWKSSSSRFVDDDVSDAESACEEMDTQSELSCSTASTTVQVVQLSDIAAATRVACTHELARKSRRIDADVNQGTSSAQKSLAKARACAGEQGMSGAPRVKSTLEFLHLHFSQNDGLLLHLYADTEDAAVQASRRVLQAQLESKDINNDLHNTFVQNLINASRASAIQTRSNLQSMCDQYSSRSPAIASWVEDTADGPRVYSGLMRHPQADEQSRTVSNTRLLVCKRHAVAQPPESSKTTVVWSCASCTTKCADETSRAVGCALEAFRSLHAVSSDDVESSKKVKSNVQHEVGRVCSNVLGPAETGIARSVIVLESVVPVSSELLGVCVNVASQLSTAHLAASQKWNATDRSDRHRVAHRTVLCATAPSQLAVSTPTPGATPCNVFAVGMYLLECARTALNQIAPKQSLLAVPIAPESIPSSIESIEVKRVNPLARPWCFLAINDMQFQALNAKKLYERLKHDAEDAEEGSAPPIHTRQLGIVASVTATGDRILHVPTALDYLASCMIDESSADLRLSFLRQWRALCYASGIQCSTFHQFSNSVAAREMNTKIEGTSKIDAPDNHYLSLPTIYQCFVAGHANLPTMFENTPFQNTYGAGYECGAIASVGINGRMIVSDQRNAAFALMDQTQVDTLCVRLAERGVVVRSDGKHFVRVPMAELGGLPRVMLPSVHLALSPLKTAFENLRRLRGEVDADTRCSVQVLPFSPFTQAVSPISGCCESSGMDFRDNARLSSGLGAPDQGTTDQCVRPLRTLKKMSILSSEFMSPACIKMVSPATDNVFETIEPAIAPLLIFASQIGQVAKLIRRLCGERTAGVPGADELSTLRREALAFLDGRGVADPCVACLLLDALVLFNCMFPVEFEVGKECILVALEGAHSSFFATPTLSFDYSAVENEEDASAFRRFFGRLFDDGPWPLIVELVCMVSAHGSKFDNSEKDMAKCSNIVASLGKIVWLIHSDDGVSAPGRWSPLHCRAKPEDVISLDLVCVWTDRPKVSASNRRHQRGALVGLPNAGPQQVLMLLTGAFLSNIKVQYARNEGNMCLRMSSCALKDGNEGARLTSKSTSPIYSDNDAETFGTLSAKEAQARRQVAAWRKNNELVFEVATRFDEPEIGQKFAGSNFSLRATTDILSRWKVAGAMSQEEIEGSMRLRVAASNVFE